MGKNIDSFEKYCGGRGSRPRRRKKEVQWERGEARVTPECLAWAAAQARMPLPEPETTAVGGGLWWGREW